MAETDVLYEFGREPGFSCLVFDPECSNKLHICGPKTIMTCVGMGE